MRKKFSKKFLDDVITTQENSGLGGIPSWRPGLNREIFTNKKGGGFRIRVVKNLPAIPQKPTIVFWASEDGGTGDNQLWFAAPGYSRWYPMIFITDKNGAPGS